MFESSMASLGNLKRNTHIIRNILWDIEPKQLMEPRYRETEDGGKECRIISGYIFYIDKMGRKPALFLMYHTATGYGETVARIDEIPDELIAEAIEENKDREYFRMCPINRKIEIWLKKELGIEETPDEHVEHTATAGYSSNLSFLLEIGTEDLPARFLPLAIQQLHENAGKILTETRIRFSTIKTYGNPRRLAVIAEGIHEMQDDRTKEVFGPSKKVAFDVDGRPTKAAMGFAQSQGISVENLKIKNKDKGEYVVAVTEESGLQVRELLPDVFRRIVLSLHLPKSMRWGDGNVRFVRPIRWLMALFEKEYINFEIDGIKSSNHTRGHRFLSPAAFQIKEISGYERLLANNYVIIDQKERKNLIAEKINSLLSSTDESPVVDEELLDTVVHLVEYPVPVLATYPEEYLKLPKELLITVMKGHQKYFAVQNQAGTISNHFIVISNTGEKNSETVRIGAERVIKARFEDARFYFEEDKKKLLSEKIEELKKVTFQESLGSLYKKTERLVSAAGKIAGIILPSSKDKLIRAAWLSKADLITGVVREFPELQGVMGKYYALHDGEDREVALAIEEHYLPTHSGGRIPETDAGAILSIADKIDNIVAFFSVGLTPTGSEDPFALRRQALGIIAIIVGRGFNITLRELVDMALENLADIKGSQDARENILQFFEARLESVFSDQGYSADLVQSVLQLSLNIQLNHLRYRLDAIQKIKNEKEFNDFLIAIKRVNNIIPGAEIPEINKDLLLEEAEKVLKEKLDSVKSELGSLLKNRNFSKALVLLSSLTGPINRFFDHILVMDKREEVKKNRLALLKVVWETASNFADFSKLSASQ